MSHHLKRWRLVIAAVVLLLAMLIGVLAVKTLTFASKQVQVSSKVSYPIDKDQALKHMSEAIQIPTVSNVAPIDYTQFTKFREFLEKSFPLVHATLERQINNNYNLIYIWKGSDPQKKPILLMAHYDVFAITDEGWKYPPFAGTIADDYIWGRGTIDDKISVMSMMEALEFLVKSGFQPTRTIYLALGQDEEGGGRQGALKEAEYFKAQGLQFETMMDEGLVTTQGVFPGLPASQWIDLIGTEEKGFLNLKLTAEALSGHSSMPPRETSIGILAAAIHKLESNPFPVHITGATSDFFDYMGREMAFPYNLIFANRWLFEPLLEGQLAQNPKSDAMIRTTTAPDVFSAGSQPASMPGSATAVINFRIMPGETMQTTTDRVRAIINDPRIHIEPVTGDEGVWEPPATSTADTWSFQVISKTAREVMPDVLVSPCLVTGATDGRYFAAAGLTLSWYRTVPARIPVEDLAGMHGVNERILVSSYLDSINYYIRLMHNFSET